MSSTGIYDHSTQRLLSRKLEGAIYLDAMTDMYNDAFELNQKLYLEAAAFTKNFTNIDAAAILEDSRIIKIFRYAIAPSISQMKFGQFFGLNSIDQFENRRVTAGSTRKVLEVIAPNIANFINKNIDKSRFVWLDDPTKKTEEAFKYAMMWTCSLSSDQNAQTSFRNWRKCRQEESIKDVLLETGYTQFRFKGVLENLNDLNVGEFTTEIRVKGRTRQKADVVCRSRKTGQLVLIEAKAVGVELDATKRIKECCDKSGDWKSSSLLGSPSIVAVIAGFFNDTNISNLQASDISIVWEHDLNELRNFL